MQILCSMCESFTLTFRPVVLNQDISCPILHYVQPVHLWGVAQVLILEDLDSSFQNLCTVGGARTVSKQTWTSL